MIVWTLAWEVSLVRKYISVCTCSWECMYRGSIARMHVSMCMCTYMCACTQMPEVNTRYLPCSLSAWFLKTDTFTKPTGSGQGVARILLSLSTHMCILSYQALCTGAWGSNTSPHACLASTLPNEPPSSIILYVNKMASQLYIFEILG